MIKKVLLTFIPLLLTLSFTSCKGKYSNYILSCMGDSITYGYTPKTGEQMDKPYPTLLKERLGFGKVNNYGIPGSCVSNGPKSTDSMVDRMNSIDSNSNIIIFWGGGNDWGHDCPIGAEGNEDTTTLYGGLNYAANYLNNEFPNSFKMFITPLPIANRYYYDGSYHEVRDAIMYTANKHNIPVLDMYNESRFEEEKEENYSDGIHPTQDFVKNIMVPKIYSFIKEKAKL